MVGSGYNKDRKGGSPVCETGERPTGKQVFEIAAFLPWGLGGGYFFRLLPKEIAAITSISSAIVSVRLMGFLLSESAPPFLLGSV